MWRLQPARLDSVDLRVSIHEAKSGGPLHVHQHAAERGARLAGHGHASPHLCIVLRGGFAESTGRRSERADRGVVRISAAATAHELRFGAEGGVCTVIEVTARDAAAAREWAAPLPQRFLRDERSRQLGLALAAAAARDAAGFAAESLALRLLARATPSTSGAAPAWLPRALAWLHRHWSEPLAVARLAAAVDVHPVHLARVFRRHLGRTPSEYAAALRLHAARHALRASTLPISSVAQDSGFADQSHLGRGFRRRYGATPGAWRRMLQRF